MSFTLTLPRRSPRAAVLFFLLAGLLPPLVAAQGVYHVLEKGETLYSVARSYGVSPDAIAKANSLDDPSRLRAGKKLLIPVDSSVVAVETLKYKVVKGDTLFSIARTYGVGLAALRAANKLTTTSILKVGDTIVMPADAKALPAISTTTAPVSTTAIPTPAAPMPAMPDAVKTSTKPLSKDLSWPCPGDILYLDGKAYGVVIRAKLGETLKAVASGIVSSAGPYRGYGNVVFVLSQGYIYVYGGNESISVRAGDRVAAGQELGRVGLDVKQGGPAAYFLVFRNGVAVDPASAPRG